MIFLLKISVVSKPLFRKELVHIFPEKLRNGSLYIVDDSNLSKNIFKLEDDYLMIYQDKVSIQSIYIYESSALIGISNSLSTLVKYFKNITINKKYILENVLFNYSFKTDTIYNEIKIIPASCSIKVCQHVVYLNKFEIEDLFVSNPISRAKSSNHLVDLFIEVNKNKISDGDYISFTGGFDGRSLVALSKYYKKNIKTYSIGTEGNDDLTLPRKQAEQLGIKFSPINLDNEKYLNEFWELGKEIIIESGASTNFLQVHWPYSARLLSSKTQNLISGVFGSELFRAAHIAGQFTSPALVDYFKNIESDLWIEKIKHANSLKFLKIENFQNELEVLIDELNDYKKSIIHLNPSQRFYKYIFEEVFRKFFGLQFLNPQLKYVNIVTPYLDFEFVKELLKTDLAGVNNDFFTHNPLKRFKGQLFYAKLIEKTFPELLRLKTGKGYSPSDLLSLYGKASIASNYFYKKFKRKTQLANLDNLSIISGYEKHSSKFNQIEINEEYFNTKLISEYRTSDLWKNNIIERDKFIETLSLNLFLSNYE